MVKYESDLIKRIEKEKIIVIVRGIKQKDCIPVAEALVAGGIRFIEVTMNTEGATEIISEWREYFKHDDVCIGAGTVLDTEMAFEAIQAGAQYIVTPNLDEDVVDLACKQGIEIFPGVVTPTEIMKAIKAGANAVKLFPMGSLGLNYLKEIRAPLSNVKIIATGGVNLYNIQDYFKLGVIGVGIGSNIVNKTMIDSRNFRGLTELAKQYIELAKMEE
ncbi:bifunctional 4-hydroxy-2-oxoglutarate aldolase/2-dehydro-3-deoxy-phosphogluconate aldolase [Bacillus sp. FJAT-49732]|uniref:Bifunctional 4-hydroxy-2-oxoglutarate aldolase/2-dehydro-3-deoxy-phosphogluconate aldolase n=1 Tax=Lederbergia citrisecunda TaxID=2833583 RepID=A0A942TPV5_9BACI|nr:bifunctional 4-hydroxy-2-oxoglutarate aldolase/2-dehydro-3-deoxy-phosphogluconate aldolase [Lederbergia citrisecunda]MBS4199882.1 bifunctional 4-hydroxy-2-oxoglutarate aldolase/2-dehydro-3-deoxy-phosphogluconate aldolase [Lederbergia citrisecunda]